MTNIFLFGGIERFINQMSKTKKVNTTINA